MRIQGNAPSGTTGETAETAASTEAQSAPPAEGQVVRSPDGQVQLPASGTRMDIQSRLLEASAPPEVSAVAGSTGVGSIDAPSGAGEHAELRAAFDRIDKPSGIASTYRIDSNNDAFASRWKTLEGATKTFDTTYFIWEKDIFGMAYLGHMLKKANDGVAIRGMMDATGDAAGTKGFKATFRGQDYLQELVGVDPDRVQIGIFNPLLKKDFSSLKGIVASNHDKLAIADGDTLETGGRNMAAHYYSDPEDHGGVYRDTDIHIENTTVAGQATDAFEAEFNSNVTEMVKPELLANFSPKDIQLLGTHAMMDQWLKAEPLSDAQVTEIRELHHEGKPMPKHMVDDVVAKAVAALPGLGIDRQPSGDDMTMLREMASQLISNPSLRGDYNSFNPTSIEGEVKIIDNTSASTGAVNEISPALLDIIDSAQESIYIHNPYVVLTDTALNKLAEAGERGVKIVFGTNSPESTDSAVTQAYFQEDWPLILARVPNSQIMVATGDQKHHAKSFVIDGVLTGVSTYNADWISARVNSEVVALEWSEEFAADTEKNYAETMADPAHDVVEYKILRDKEGKAMLVDGKPVIDVGPEDHMDPEALDRKYSLLRKVAVIARDNLPGLEPLRHAELRETTDHVRVMDWETNDGDLTELVEHSGGRRALEGKIDDLESGWTNDTEAAQIMRLRSAITERASTSERAKSIVGLMDGFTNDREELQIHSILTDAPVAELSDILDEVPLDRLASELEDDELGAVMAHLAGGAAVGNNAGHLTNLLRETDDDATGEMMSRVSNGTLRKVGNAPGGRKALERAIKNLDAGWTTGWEADQIDRLKGAR